MPKSRLLEFLAAGVIAVAAGAPSGALAATPSSLKAPMQVQSQIDSAAAKSQQRVDNISDQTQNMLDEYLTTSQQIDRTRTYNDQVEKLIRSQEEEKISLKKQLGDVGIVEKEIVPLMLHMIDSLDQFVKLDVPFLLPEREKRVNDLRKLMDSADITISEKYRKVMEAYQIEIDYGKTIEAYRGQLKTDGKTRTVDFLRVGRLLLAYQTLDRAETGFWNKTTRKWAALPDSYRNAVTEGLRIARHQVAPQLLTLPVAAPEAAK